MSWPSCRRLAATVLVLGLFALPLSAAIPNLISYQGRLTTPAGTAVPDGSYSVTFTIYDVPTGGVALWTETQTLTASSGLISTMLGYASGLLGPVFAGSPRYLGVKVGTDPEMTPRQILGSAPWAYRVGTVDSALGGSIIGDIKLQNSSAGNLYKADTLFLHNFGADNTFLGQGAGNLTMTGARSSAVGKMALHSNTIGNNNTTVGFSALGYNTTGSMNTATGAAALYFNTTGSLNTATGGYALANNIQGDSNTAIGYYALYSNSTGAANTAAGAGALNSNTTGYQNTATGATALQANTTGYYNTAVGNGALQSNTEGHWNTASGTEALLRNTTGNANCANGYLAMWDNTTGGYNSAFGFSSLRNNTVGYSNTAIGVALKINTSGYENTAVGLDAAALNVTGYRNTAIGVSSGPAVDGLSNTAAIGYQANVYASNTIRLGNSSITTIEGQVPFTFTSDKNQKENFQPVDGNEVLEKILSMNVTTWNYRGHDPEKFRHYGPVAQEFFAAFGHDAVGQCGDSVTINSGDEAGILMIAVQALAERSEALERRAAEIEEVKAENTELKARLAKLEARLSRSVRIESSNGQIGRK